MSKSIRLQTTNEITTIQKGDSDQKVVFNLENSLLKLDLRLRDGDLWVSQNDLALLFNRDRSVICRHIRKVFKSKAFKSEELNAIFATTATDRKVYQITHYNLKMISIIGCKINVKQTKAFKDWAVQVVKPYLNNTNKKYLETNDIKDFELSKNLLRQKLRNRLFDPNISIAQKKKLVRIAKIINDRA